MQTLWLELHGISSHCDKILNVYEIAQTWIRIIFVISDTVWCEDFLPGIVVTATRMADIKWRTVCCCLCYPAVFCCPGRVRVSWSICLSDTVLACLSPSVSIHPSWRLSGKPSEWINSSLIPFVSLSVSDCLFVHFITASASLSLYLRSPRPSIHPVRRICSDGAERLVFTVIPPHLCTCRCPCYCPSRPASAECILSAWKDGLSPP